MLNTEVFNHGNPAVVAGRTVDAALAQLAWLNGTLASARAAGEIAYIMGHVPIGLETAYMNDHTVPSSARPYWLDLFAARYATIVDSFGEEVVAVQIFGHEHVDTFRLLGQRTVALTAPSLSTGYPRTNPTFRKWRHDPAGTGRVIDYDQYHLDLLAANARHGGDATISAAAGGGAAGEGGTDQGGKGGGGRREEGKGRGREEWKVGY